MKKSKIIFTVLFLVAMFFAINTFAKQYETQSLQDQSYLAKPTTRVVRTLSNINNWSYWMYYDGKSGITPGGESGGTYPRGTATAIFADGFVWGGYVDGQIRVGGQTYAIGTQAGWIKDDGTAVSQDDPRVKIYRIRSDYKTLTKAMVLQDAAELNMVPVDQVTDAMAQAVIDQYVEDWETWPGDLGAPYIDKNGNGVWDGSDVDEPGIAKADQVVWFVCNDLDVTSAEGLYGSPPIGIELQVTAWGYNQPSARIGQLIFKKYKLINKSGKDVTDMYAAQWCDPDLGEAGDDLVGCDTTLSMGFVYNGAEVDNKYLAFELAPAAMGYDFFQGPLLDGVAGEDLNKNGIDDAEDYAVFNLKKVGPGKINLPMTTFAWFAAGSAISDPTLHKYEGTLQWYNMLRGYIPTDDIDNPTPWHIGNDPNKPVTKYPMAGDPVTETGDLDDHDQFFSPGDRRLGLCTGPFTFADGDTQEVVVAIVGGIGSDRLSSVADMKLTDAVAQTLYDGLFEEVPKAPPAPVVKAIPFEDKIKLDWGSDLDAVSATEDFTVAGYTFEGYVLYQLPSMTAPKSQAKRIATFDLINNVKTIWDKRFLADYGKEVVVPLQYGKDTGVQRHFTIEKDYLNGRRLYEGSTYYFAVTAYNKNLDPGRLSDAALESALIVTPVVVQEPVPGTRLSESVDNAIEVSHAEGPSDGQVEVTVIDPNDLKGHSYEVFFTVDEDTSSDTYGETLWNIRDKDDNNKVVISNQLQVSDLAVSNQPIFDGIQVKVAGPAPGIKSIVELDPNTMEVYDSNLWGSLNNYGRSQGWPVMIIHESSGLDLGRVDRFGTMTPKDYDIIFTDDDSTLAWDYYTDFVLKDTLTGNPSYLPFTFWRIDLDGTRTRLAVCILDEDESGTWNRVREGLWGPAFELLYVYDNAEYKPEDVADYISTDDGTVAPGYGPWGVVYPAVNRLCFAMYIDVDGYATEDQLDDSGFFLGPPHAGEYVRIITNKPNTEDDVFAFKTEAPVIGSEEYAKEDVKKINVYPNPYYAYNSQSTNIFDNFVTFTHLPEKATIRIFTLAGIEVRKLEKNDPSQFVKWDLHNESDLPVASGMYIVYVDMPDLGKDKILKLSIIQGKQVLEYY